MVQKGAEREGAVFVLITRKRENVKKKERKHLRLGEERKKRRNGDFRGEKKGKREKGPFYYLHLLLRKKKGKGQWGGLRKGGGTSDFFSYPGKRGKGGANFVARPGKKAPRG